jgi:hypothetical protein
VEVTITIVVCSAVVLIATVICITAYKSCINDAVHAKELSQANVYNMRDVVASKESELKRLQELLEKLLEKAPSVTIKKEE